jgi:hypothetical protein
VRVLSDELPAGNSRTSRNSKEQDYRTLSPIRSRPKLWRASCERIEAEIKKLKTQQEEQEKRKSTHISGTCGNAT